jgi:REP element-mobilizing transposase RayT
MFLLDDLVMFLTCKSSTTTTAWFLLMLSEVLCKKSFLMLAARYWKGALWSPSYFAASCGGAPIIILKDYIQQQKAPL